MIIPTAGSTRSFPERAVGSSENLIFGVKPYPLQDLAAPLPCPAHHAYGNSSVVKISDGFAAVFILIGIVFLIDPTARTLLRRYRYD